MGNFDTQLNRGSVGLGNVSQSGAQPKAAVSSEPSVFRRILGGVTGLAGNMFAPGLGGALGRVIGGTSFSSTAGFSSILNTAQAANTQAATEASQLLQVAQVANEQQEMTEMMSNLAKSKHDTAMSVIQSIGS